MNSTTKPLTNIVDILKSVKSQEIRLFFVTRHLKPGISKAAKMLDKYGFRLFGVDIEPALQEMFLDITRQQIVGAVENKDLAVTEYEAIDDDTAKLYSYDIKNRAIPFREVVQIQIKHPDKIVTDIGGFLKQEELWAYCVQINKGIEMLCLTFTKLYKNRVAVDEAANPESPLYSKLLRTTFNVKAAKLELLEGDTINFDRRVDCLYSFETEQMYVFNKSNFERIVSLEEEFRAIAQLVAAKLKKAAIIDGLENVAQELENDTVLHKRLYKLAKTIDVQMLDKKRVQKMRLIIRQFRLEVKIMKDKLHVQTKRDLDEVIKLLEDYYLKSQQTGNLYGAPVKTKIVV